MKHNTNRHAIALASASAVSALLLPAMATIGAATMGMIQVASHGQDLKVYGDPQVSLDTAIKQLDELKLVLDDQIRLFNQVEDQQSIVDFTPHRTNLIVAGVIGGESTALISMLEQQGFLATYVELSLMVDEHITDAKELRNFDFNADPAAAAKLAVSIGGKAMATQIGFTELVALIAEAWAVPHHHRSIIPAMPDQVKRAANA